MPPALKGFLIGLAISLFLVIFEYLTVKKAVEERARATHRKPEFEPSDRSRIRAVVNFALFVPPGLALGFWLLD